MSVRIAGGRLGGRVLKGPPRNRGGRNHEGQEVVRPSGVRLRKSLFAVLAGDLVGSRVVDVCAGVGTLGVEAISWGAQACVFVERSALMARLIERNTEWVTGASIEVIVGDAAWAMRRLQRAGEDFEVVFLDPPWALWETGEGVGLLAGAVALAPLVVAEHRSSWCSPLRVCAGPEDETGSGRDTALRTRRTIVGDGAYSLYRRERPPRECTQLS